MISAHHNFATFVFCDIVSNCYNDCLKNRGCNRFLQYSGSSRKRTSSEREKAVRNGAGRFREGKNTEFVWELTKRDFAKWPEVEAVHLPECPLRELPLYYVFYLKNAPTATIMNNFHKNVFLHHLNLWSLFLFQTNPNYSCKILNALKELPLLMHNEEGLVRPFFSVINNKIDIRFFLNNKIYSQTKQ